MYIHMNVCVCVYVYVHGFVRVACEFIENNYKVQ